MWLIKDSARRGDFPQPRHYIFIIVTAVGGFLPQFLLNDVEALDSLECEIIYASNLDFPFYQLDIDDLKARGIRLHQIPIKTSPVHVFAHLRTIASLRRLMNETGADVVCCHNPMGGVDARIAAVLSKKRPYVIYTTHGFHFYKGAPLVNRLFYEPVERLLARVTDRIIAVNREDARQAAHMHLHGCGKFGVGKVNRIPGVGVDAQKFRPAPELRDKVRRELAIPKDAFHIVTAGEVNQNKNQAVVIEAMHRLEQENEIRDIYYTICGTGDLSETLQKMIVSYGMEDRVRLVGLRKDMERILSGADVFAFPSIREGFGIAPVEAMLCAVPIICGDNRGTREYARDGINGIVCPNNSLEEWTQAIRRLYSDRDYLATLAKASRRSAKHFCNPVVKKRMRKIYEEVLCEIANQ